jgi:hypothetical protein
MRRGGASPPKDNQLKSKVGASQPFFVSKIIILSLDK